MTLSVIGRTYAVLSCLLFFIGCGALWAYLSLIGTGAGLGDQAVANALGFSQFGGIAGALIAGLIGARFGRLRPLCLALLGAAGVSLALAHLGAGGQLAFAALAFMFNFGWNFNQPVYLATATGFDQGGRLVSQMAASQACGLAVGPLLGAALGGEHHVRILVWVIALTLLAALGLILMPFSEARRRSAGQGSVAADWTMLQPKTRA